MKKCLKTKLFAAILQSCLAPQAKILDIWSANYTLERRSWSSQNLNVLFFHSSPQILAFRAKLRQTHFHEIDFFGASRQDFFFGIQVGSFGIQLRQPCVTHLWDKQNFKTQVWNISKITILTAQLKEISKKSARNQSENSRKTVGKQSENSKKTVGKQSENSQKSVGKQ